MSNRGKRKLLHEGHSYDFAKTLKITDEELWRCDQNRTNGCKHLLYVLNGKVTRQTHTHSCFLPNPERNKGLEVASWMKERAADTREPPRMIIAQATAGLQPAELAQCRAYKTAQRAIQRVRKRNDLPYPTPASLADIEIPEELQKTKTGETFLLHDTGPNDPARIIVFGSPPQLDALRHSQHWYADGTFKVCPTLFSGVILLYIVCLFAGILVWLH